MDKTIAKYKCKQNELYAGLELAWNRCKTNLAPFAARFIIYTLAYISDKLKAIAEAKKLPDLQQRKADKEMAQVKLVEMRGLTRNIFQFLMDYIELAFPKKDEQKIQVNKAGHAHFVQFTDNDWNAGVDMMDAGVKYTSDNEPLLKDKGMPDNFLTDLTKMRDDLVVLRNNFFTYGHDSEDKTDEKLKANNTIYEDGMVMLGHGQRIFSTDVEMKNSFVWENLLEEVGRHLIAGVRGNIIDGDTELPIKDVQVSNQTKEHNEITNAEGNYHIKGLGEGKDIITAEAPNYTKATQSVDLKAGETTTIDIKLFKAP